MAAGTPESVSVPAQRGFAYDPDMNFVAPILQHALATPAASAIIENDRTISYGELAGFIRRTAGHLRNLGIAVGDRVGVCLGDDWETLVAVAAVAYAGAATVPMDWRSKEDEKTRVVAALGLKLILVRAQDGAIVGGSRSVALDADWRRAVDKVTEPGDALQDWNATLLISSTSGTTGSLKFTGVTHLQNYFRAINLARPAPASGRCRYLSALPLCFGVGLLRAHAYLMDGGEVIMHPPLFTASEFVEVANRHQVSELMVTPGTVRQLLGIGGGSGFLLPHVGALSVTGSPMFPEEKRAAIRIITPNFVERYGASGIGNISTLYPKDFANRADSVGQPHALVEVEIVDDQENPLPRGQVGRIRLRGPTLGFPVPVPGGAENPYEWFGQGWYYPGEIAMLDEQYYLYLKGRMFDLIMRNGVKILPAEIETVIQEHAHVLESAVVGVRQADNEEAIVAFVVARGRLDTGELLAHCRTRLAAYKMPREIHVVAEMPRNIGGKISKIALINRLQSRPAAAARG
jgi:acyl-coenzyme A synthetase/AMP-(fatty) acid ligase